MNEDEVNSPFLPSITPQVEELSREIRMEQYLARHPNILQQYKGNTHLILAICMYFAEKYQDNDLFGHGNFDVAEFCKKYDYDKSNLFRTIDNPIYDNEKGDVSFYKTLLGDTLFRLLTKNLVLTTMRSNIAGVQDFSSAGYQLVQNLDVIYDTVLKGNKKGKAIIKYKCDPNFIAAISKSFVYVKPSKIKQLRKNNTDLLYMFIAGIKDKTLFKQNLTFTPYFNYMCEMCEINKEGTMSNSDSKKALTKKLNILKNESDLNFNWEYIRIAGKYKYGVQLTFSMDDLIAKNNQKVDYKTIFINALVKELEILFEIKYKNIAKEKDLNRFLKWLSSDNYEMIEKLDLHFKYYQLIYGKNKIQFEVNKLFPKAIEYIHQYYNKLE